jgi:hypothetical protein
MALKQQSTVDVKLVGSVQVTSYIRVAHIAGTKHQIIANVVSHKDNASGEAFKAGNYKFSPDMNGGNFIRQAYDHIKSLPEFTNAVDC